DPFRVTACHERSPRWGTDWARHMKISELSPLGGEADEIRGFRPRGTERLDVGIAQVVAVDDDEVRTPLGRILIEIGLSPHQGQDGKKRPGHRVPLQQARFVRFRQLKKSLEYLVSR